MATFPDWLTVAELRALYPDELSDLTDAAIQLEIDNMTAYVENLIGHGFGRVAIVQSTATENVEIASGVLTLGGDTYTLADYTTMLELEVAVNEAASTYRLDLLQIARPEMSPAYLRDFTATACGPTYDQRQVLSISHDMHQGTGGESHFFLPYALYSVASVIESGTALASTYYWAQVGKSYIIRKYCSCATSTCYHPMGRWKSTYPGNMIVYYRPRYWLSIPGDLSAVMLQAVAAGNLDANDEGLAGESFLSYSYSKNTGPARTWQDQIANHSSLQRYQQQSTF